MQTLFARRAMRKSVMRKLVPVDFFPTYPISLVATPVPVVVALPALRYRTCTVFSCSDWPRGKTAFAIGSKR